MLILNVADREADDFQSHVGHVGGGHVADLLGERHPVTVDILNGHGAENGALLALEGLQGDLCNLVDGFAEELLGSGPDGLLAASHLHLSDAVDRY